MRIFVTGGHGQLGTDLVPELERRGHIAYAPDISELDLTKPEMTKAAIRGFSPDAIIHLAAWTAVDKAEDFPEECRKINSDATRTIAEEARELSVPMMYISTDYVFNGSGENPWKPEDVPDPLNIYGKTKREGEEHVLAMLDKYFIVRISWVFGKGGNNFVKTMLHLGRERDDLSVVSDQIGSPTYTADLSILLADMIVTDGYGIYHASNEGFCSWYELARFVIKESGGKASVRAVPSSGYPSKAKRPMNSRMDKSKLEAMGYRRLPKWQDAVTRYLKEEINGTD